jgi:hypothetical protein
MAMICPRYGLHYDLESLFIHFVLTSTRYPDRIVSVIAEQNRNHFSASANLFSIIRFSPMHVTMPLFTRACAL